MKKTAFVTGASGFLGRYVARCLAKHGFHVSGIGRDNWRGCQPSEWGIDFWKTADVTMENLVELSEAVGEPAVIAHCAGGASVGFSLDHTREDFHSTVTTALEVLEFARRRAPRVRVAYPSSAAVYGTADVALLSESAPLAPISPYGLHKKIVEDLFIYYAARWRAPAVLVRFFSLYGEGLRKQLLWDACNKARDGAFSFFGAGDELRDWLHVSDAAELFRIAVEHADLDCPIVNGGTGEGCSIRVVLTQLGRLWSPRVVPAFSRNTKPGDPRRLVADIRRAQSWGFAPKVELISGLAGYVSWFRKEFGL